MYTGQTPVIEEMQFLLNYGPTGDKKQPGQTSFADRTSESKVGKNGRTQSRNEDNTYPLIVFHSLDLLLELRVLCRQDFCLFLHPFNLNNKY